jgi:hypothetical protein
MVAVMILERTPRRLSDQSVPEAPATHECVDVKWALPILSLLRYTAAPPEPMIKKARSCSAKWALTSVRLIEQREREREH